MLDTDKKEFSEVVRATLSVYRVEASADVLRVWWGVLQSYTIEQVRNGFSRFVSSKESKYPPVPAHIVEAIELNEPDGRLGADEAWATYPRDEISSAVINNEIAEAMQSAQPLIKDGDMIAARMAFKDAYNRIVARNKNAGIKPKWFPSLGSNPQGHEDALKAAAEKGLLSKSHVDGLLPSPVNKLVDNALRIGKVQLTDEQREKNMSKLAEARKVLEKAA